MVLYSNMSKVQERVKAIELRRQGYTYREIMKVVPNIAKGTLSRWCSNMVLTPIQVERINQRSQNNLENARLAASETNRKRRELRDQRIRERAERNFKRYYTEPFFNFGLVAYWAEGAKTQRNFQFTNSDPGLVSLMMKWIEKYLGIHKNEVGVRLYTHHLYENEKCEEFWAQVLDIPKRDFSRTIYKPTPHIIKTNPHYKGCMRIDLGKVWPWITVMTWQDCFKKLMRL